jgi:hypothetical protein
MACSRDQKGLTMNITLSLTESHHDQLRNHLFPGDGMEAIAFALCGHRHGSNSLGLLVHEIVPLPYDCCKRAPDYIQWRTEKIPEILDRATKKGFSVVKIHSHPNGFDAFSLVDDRSDRDFFTYASAWTDNMVPHASVVMFLDGSMKGRTLSDNDEFQPIECIKFIGDDLKFWFHGKEPAHLDEYGIRVVQAFGQGTYQLLKALKIGVVGCSGTGSLVVEQLARNCVGDLVLVDPERIEIKNLNRIPQATMDDALNKEYKVNVIARSIEAMRFGTQVTTITDDLYSFNAVKALSECDVLFGCMDSIDGRHLLNKLATAYIIPYFDIGVKLFADGVGGIDQICGTVHYLQPGGSSLLSRGVYTQEQLRAASMKRADPRAYREQLKAGYIEGVDEEKPAVISVNMLFASLGVNELLARLHPFRDDLNADFAIHRIALHAGSILAEPDGEPCATLKKWVGRGDIIPLLGMPSLSNERN